jgi:Domain of unknown function (DUF4148)
MFKSLIPAAVLAVSIAAVAALAAPTAAMAQTSGTTRAQVKAQLVQLERAGYNPSGDRTDYPANIQAAQRRVDAENGNSASSYGASTNGSSASGARAFAQPASPVYPIDFGRP